MRRSSGEALRSGLATKSLLELVLSERSEPDVELDRGPLLFEDDLGLGVHVTPALAVLEGLDDVVRLARRAELAERLRHLGQAHLGTLGLLLPRASHEHLHE